MSLIKDIMEKYSTPTDRISQLKQKSVDVMGWDRLKRYYYPHLHKIVTDRTGRHDKELEDGSIEKAARIYIGLEQLLVSRMSSFMFAIPVKRVYSESYSEDLTDEEKEERKKVIRAIEKVYKHARINNENLFRSKEYFASCEIFTLWYASKEKNKKYGFDSDFKIKCKTYSPKEGTALYPLFDDTGDMVAMSIEYKRVVENKNVTFFETWTADAHYKWSNDGNGWKSVLKNDNGESIDGVSIPKEFGKIPGVYAYRKTPIYEKAQNNIRENIEYKLSENSDTISYNSAPVIKIAGGLKGDEKKGESQRIIRVENGGDVSYVSWQQSIEAMKYHVETMMDMYFMLSQLPNISASKMMQLSNVSFESRQMLFADAHMKVGDESGAWLELLEREFNIVKQFLKMAHKDWSDILDDIDCDFVITPFIQNDLKSKIDELMAANGGKALLSQRTAIKRLDIVDDVDKELEQIKEDGSGTTEGNPFPMYTAQ